MHRTGWPVVLTIGFAACATAPAAAQNALGGGDALDSSPYANRPGRNPRTPLEDYRARNLIVTNNVAAGRGFRGTVGYTAEFDFRGVQQDGEGLGSNDLFLERANMALSDPNLLGAGRTFERLRYGQYRGAFEYRRSGYGAHVGTVLETRLHPGQVADDRLWLDRITLSSTSQMIYESASDAQIIGMVEDREQGQRYIASASSLSGVQLTPTQTQIQLIGLTSYDMARIVADLEAGIDIAQVGHPFERDLSALGSAAGTELDSGRVEPADAGATPILSPEYRSIMEGVVERASSTWQLDREAEPDLLTRLDEELEALRAQLEQAEESAEPTPPAWAEMIKLPGDEEEPAPEETAPPGIDELAGPLRHGRRLEKLTSDDQSRFDELMTSAQEKLGSGEYFWAERRFARALRFTPDHPLATAGMANAQIGAGLYVPAALTIRRLLTLNPEMIDVQYGPELLPSRVRLNTVVRDLRMLIAKEERDRALHGFLLAYLGHQMDDRSMTAEGLRVMAASAPDDRLHDLLEAVWLGEDAGP